MSLAEDSTNSRTPASTRTKIIVIAILTVIVVSALLLAVFPNEIRNAIQSDAQQPSTEQQIIDANNYAYEYATIKNMLDCKDCNPFTIINFTFAGIVPQENYDEIKSIAEKLELPSYRIYNLNNTIMLKWNIEDKIQ